MNGKPPYGKPSYGKPAWEGVAPSPQIFDELDPEETTVLAFLAWSSASNRPVTAAEVAELPDRNGRPLGLPEAKTIARHLMDLKIVSVLGMNNERALSIFMGGFQPASRRPSGPPRSQVAYPKAEPDQIIEHRTGGLPIPLKTTALTPAFVPEESKKLRAAQAEVEGGKFGDDLVGAATERRRILVERIALYDRWLGAEPSHPILRKFLERKRKALPELEFQLERSRVKKAELEAEKAAEASGQA